MNDQKLSAMRASESAADHIGRLVPAVAAMLLGSFLVLGVGFAQIDTVHNAAHDGRHSFAFPCH
jgi:cobalt transporter subunit CbtB